MKAVRFHEHGGVDVLRFEDAPDPTQIAISADTDDTGSTSRGFVDALAFVGREPAPPVTE